LKISTATRHSLGDDLLFDVTRVCRIARGAQQRGRMLPNIRLMIAAILGSVLALSCGFGIFAVFRVSHEPFAHLPAPMAPPQLVAENVAPLPARDGRAGEMVGWQIGSLLRPVDDAVPPMGAPEIHATAYAEELELRAVPDPIAAAVMGSRPLSDAQEKPSDETSAAIDATAPQPATLSVTVAELPPIPQSEGRTGDPIGTSWHDRLESEPTEPLAADANEASLGKKPADEPANAATGAIAEALPSTTALADVAPPTVTSGVPTAAGATKPAGATDRLALEPPPDFPLPRERPNGTPAAAESPAIAAERRPASAAAPPRHPRIIARAVRAVRFTSAYYTRVQYVQSTDPGYGYGQAGDAAQEQIAIRRVVRSRLAVRRIYPATSIRSQ
jgi:hypothetical protein